MRTIEADERAVRAAVTLVARATTMDLGRPTPCAGWDLKALLAHMTAQHRGFAAAAAGHGADPAAWQLDDHPLLGYAEATAQVIAAFAAPGTADRDFILPEVAGDRPIRGATAIGFHLVDYVVHGWDVARTLGERYVLDDALAAAAERIAAMVPDGPERLSASAAFRPALRPSPATDPVEGPATTPLDRVLLALGRSPDWPA